MQVLRKLGATVLLLLALSVHHTAPSSERLRRQAAGSCLDPGTPSHALRRPAEFRRSFSEGAVLSYRCSSGYTLHGSSQLTCRWTNGRTSWSAPVPQCRGEKSNVHGPKWLCVSMLGCKSVAAIAYGLSMVIA